MVLPGAIRGRLYRRDATRGMVCPKLHCSRDCLGRIPLLFRLAARAQSKNALGQAYLLVGKPNVLRVDFDEREQDMDLDDVQRAKAELPNFARTLAEGNGSLVKQMFLSSPADLYVPCESK